MDSTLERAGSRPDQRPRVAGIDVDAVAAWIGAHVEELEPPFTWNRLEGGHSNLTYEIRDAQSRVAVVRRPPLGELLPKAHDMGREFRVISALHPTRVPVARPLAYCSDPAVTGAPYYVMAKVDGTVLHSTDDVEAHVPRERRRGLGEHFIHVLAELHSLDPGEIGLADLGRPDHYVARQLHRWHESWKASYDAAKIHLPEIDHLHTLLAKRIPDQGPVRVVHGDYALRNCIVGSEHRIAAVLDWEISTLGDPLADLAYAMNGWVEPGDEPASWIGSATVAPGFPTRADLLERYASQSGLDLGEIDFYVAFNYWKSVCIAQGVYARYVKGQKSTQGVDLEALEASIRRSAERAAVAAGKLG